LRDAPEPQAAATPKSYAIRLSFWAFALVITTLVLVVIVVVLFVILIVATCRSAPPGAMRQGLQTNVAAKDGAGDAELFCDNTPQIALLNEGNLFQHVENY
jgi:hypothetical protein